MDFTAKLRTTLRDALANPLLIVPLIFEPIVIVIVGLLMSVVAVLELFSMQGLPLTVASLEVFEPTSAMLPVLGLMFFIALLLVIIIDAWFKAGWLAMLRTIAQGKKATTVDFFVGVKDSFKNFLGFRILISLIWAILLTPIVIVGWSFLSSVQNPSAWTLGSGLLFLLLLGFTILAGLAMKFVFSFSPVLLVTDRLSVTETFRASFRLIKESTIFVLVSVAIVIGFGIAFWILSNILGYASGALAPVVPERFGLAIQLAVQIFTIAVQFCLMIYKNLFLFEVYAERKKELATK